ncbi:CRISPR-associated endonuclease Cas2 [Rothia uropygioeca]|uniref:CRISPR-associated endonuclease Cas2 n=1 Tax=Kocuria sp. 257 TaxID=2021970 RepID=UPI001013407A|nr:CRISPR-associated endonuclease Cas2 [Kocuria sp. 257]
MSRDDARRFLVTYDIPSDKRRARVATELGHYGDRVQYSVFLFDISPAAMTRLKSGILEMINSSEDSVLVCDLGLVKKLSDQTFQYLGIEREDRDDSLMIY